MSAAERMKMAPVVNEFTKNYNKSRGLGAIGKNVLKIGAIGAGLGAAYLAGRGSRDFGTPSQELGQDLVETSTASNLVQNAAEKAAASTATNTISQSITTDQTPKQSLENAAETSTPPSQLNINESVEASVKKPTPNIDAALERRSVKLPSATTIREKYNRYETTPQKQQKGAEQTLVGGGSIYVSDREGKVGETIKTEDSSGFDDKGRSILNKYVGMMKDKVDEDLKELTGPTAPDFEQTLVSDSSPLAGHPDIPPGEDDIFQHGGMNTSPTTSLAYVDPKKVMAMSMAISKGDIKQPLTPEEKLVVAAEIEKKRTPNPLEKQRTPRSPNELAGKDQAAFEAIKAGIPQEDQDAAESRVEQKTAAKQRKAGIKSPLTKQYYPEGVARTDIQVGGMKDRKTGLGRSVGISYTPLNGDTKVGFNMMSDPTKPQDVQTYDFSASPEAMQSLQTGEEGELGSETFGKLFNIAKKKQRGFGSLET
jgi:hypothetical protein